MNIILSVQGEVINICLDGSASGVFDVAAIEVGRICVKLVGREAGRKCVIVDVVDRNFALITGPKEVSGVRRRRVNINHIEPTKDSIKIKRGASDKETIEALKDSDKLEEMERTVKPILFPV